MKPSTRREMFLDAVCDGEPCGLVPATREEILLREMAENAAGGGGSGGVTSWNDLTDKPFDVTYDYELLEPASVYTFKQEGNEGVYVASAGGYYIGQLLSSPGNVAIEVDGVKYTGSVEDFTSNNVSKGLAPVENEAPVGAWAEYMGAGTYEWKIYFYGAGSTHEVAFYTPVETVKKIDEKFLPESDGGLVVWFNDDEFGLAADVIPWEIYSAVTSGKSVIGIHEEPDAFTHVYTFGGFNGDGNPYFYSLIDGKITTLTYNDDDAYTKATLS